MQHLDWSRNANIYEVNIRQYTKEGTLNAFRKHLPRLKKMAVNIIWIMPVQPIGHLNRKGTLGSYYSISDYKTVNLEFGTLDDFKVMVEEAHKLGMYVLLDWVANHTAWDHIWTKDNSDFFQKNDNGDFVIPWDWTDVIALNYENSAMRKQMIEAMKFWVEESNIDGFRCDMAGMVPVDFWNEARIELEKIKPLFMLAEDEEVVALLDYAFDMNFTWEMHHLMNAIAKGEKHAQDVWWKIGEYKEKYPEDAYRMYFTSNHDENSHSGTAEERMGNAAPAFTVLTYLLPGMPLTYSGQETATDKRLAFFEKECIDWSQTPLHNFYKTLNQLKQNNKALWNGIDGGQMINISKGQNENIFAFVREKDGNKVVVILNLSANESHFHLSHESAHGYFTNLFTGENVELGESSHFDLKPWSYLVFTN